MSRDWIAYQAEARGRYATERVKQDDAERAVKLINPHCCGICGHQKALWQDAAAAHARRAARLYNLAFAAFKRAGELEQA